MAVQILSVVSTDLFVGTEDRPRQLVRVTVRDAPAGTVEITGERVRGVAAYADTEGETTVEVPIQTDAPVGAELPVNVRVGDATATATISIAEPGWTMYLVSHFHYDPVWWNTQSAYTQTWELQGNDGSTRPVWEHNGFNLVRAHLDMARSDPDYTFVLAEVDYLKPFWDVHPEYREVLRRLIGEGRVEVMGGTYNEPNTNLTGSETTIRNLVYGVGYQKSVMGADPRTAWQLDVFGHDPQFPGLVAEAGLTSTSWARGPFHQWGPILSKFNEAGGDARNMQFPAEFEWLSPSGHGVITHYMPNHYSAGWWMDSSATLAEAEEKVLELFHALKPVAATKNTLLPVGTDYTPPNKWVTEIHRDWNARYVWPRFVCGNPRDFFAAVHAELAERGIRPSPQTRDMNPLYTGKDVSYIDTKQAQRAAEVAATDAEKLATFAALLGLGRYPEAALDKVWRQLAYGAHHDAITGSESDQVYIDLVTGWREAHDLAGDVRDTALRAILGRVDTSGEGRALTVVNTLSFSRTDVVRTTVDLPADVGMRLVDDTGTDVPYVVEAHSDTELAIAFVAIDVPGTGWRTWRLVPGTDLSASTWRTAEGTSIANTYFEVTADASRGGGLSSIHEIHSGRELIRSGQVGNELRMYDEYDSHPEFGEGPWHLLPTGNVTGSADTTASVVVEHSPAGQRIVVTGTVGDIRYEQRVTLWHGLDRLDLRTRVLDFTGADKLLRVKYPVDIPGARPVCEVAGAVIARGFALPDSDTATAPWTLDNPANTFFALSSTAHLRLLGAGSGDDLGAAAIAIAEVVVDELENAAPQARDLLIALARVGVTATTSTATGARYGWLHVDSNLPDVRIVLGGPDVNPLAAELIERAGQAYHDELKRQLDEHGTARLFVPADTSVEQSWVPNADLRDVRALPAVVIAGTDPDALASAIADLAAEFTERANADVSVIDVGPTRLLDAHTVGLLSYGTPGFAVDPSGALHMSLMRSCTGWPSGIWLDPPLRRSPDGTSFQLQHWTHDFDYALVSGAGDWRAVDLASRGREFSAPMHGRTPDAHDGDLPATYALMTVTPERQVDVQTIKPAGNPSATGECADADPADGMTVRLVETSGRTVVATVDSVFGWTSAHHTNLLENETRDSVYDDGRIIAALDGAQIATIVGVPAQARAIGDETIGANREIAQPVYARYWLHNRGPAPMGFFPVSVSADPTVFTVDGGTLDTVVTVASQYTTRRYSTMLTVGVPDEWAADPAERPVVLTPGGHTSFPVRLTPPTDVLPGLYFARVGIGTGDDTIEDVITLLVPGGENDRILPPPPGPEIDHAAQINGTVADEARALGLEITSITDGITVAPGERATLRLRLTSRAADRIDGEAMPVSPWGTWDLIGPYATGFSVPPGADVDVEFDVTAPIDAEPGHWWVMVKLMWSGRIQYSPAVRVEVR